MMNEFCICWVKGDEMASVTAPSHTRLKGKILRLKEAFPDEVEVHENKDGSIVAYVPVSYVKVSHPRVISEAQKEKLAKRMIELRLKKDAERFEKEKKEAWAYGSGEEDEYDEWDGIDYDDLFEGLVEDNG